MAKFVKAWREREKLMDFLVQKASEADSASAMEYRAAVRIQSWFRGCRVRAYYSHLHAMARIIQRNFRGHLGREEYRRRLESSLDDMRVEYYRDMATRIQSSWRGYYVRKYVFDYRTYKEYLKGVMEINEIVRTQTKEEQARVERERAQREEHLQELQEQEQARRHHYLLSTITKGGVFRQDSRRPPHPFEDKMRSIQFASPPALRRQWRHGRTRSSERPAAKNITTCTAPTAVSGEPYLPPLVRLQGPFKPPEEVRRLKSKPPKPTLRVATSYDSEKLRRIELRDKEWRDRLIDDKFLPFSRCQQAYPPMIHTKSPYQRHISYSLMIRPSQPEKNICSKPFQTFIPPIATFDELNSTC